MNRSVSAQNGSCVDVPSAMSQYGICDGMQVHGRCHDRKEETIEIEKNGQISGAWRTERPSEERNRERISLAYAWESWGEESNGEKERAREKSNVGEKLP